MRPSLVILALAAAVAMALSACRTTQTTTVSPSGQTNISTTVTLDPMAGIAIEAITAAAVPVAVQKDPNAANYLMLAAEVFEAAANDAAYDPAKLQAALSTISAKELRDPTAQAIITGALGFYKGAVADTVNAKVDATKYGPFLKSILHGIAVGITTGMQQ